MPDKDKERDVIATYQQGLSVPELSGRYGISDKSIYYIFKKHGVILRRRSGIGKILSQAQEEDVIALYQRGLPASQIASAYNIEDQTVYNVLERNGAKRRSASEAAITYPRNERAFDVIDNEEAAYWLGFIAADGNVSNGRLRIGLSTKDADHVRKFARWIAPDMPVYTGTNNLGRPVSTFDIGSKHLVETLRNYGIVPRKTYVMKHLPPVPCGLMRHLLRGYSDADGYFSVNAKAGARFGVVSFHREIVEEIQNWLMKPSAISRECLIARLKKQWAEANLKNILCAVHFVTQADISRNW